MSSGWRPNSTTLYLRPVADQQPYQLERMARWLVARGDFKQIHRARHWLAILEDNHLWQFRAVLAMYYAETDVVKHPYQYPLQVNDYRSTHTNLYGDEPHMWFA